MKNYTSPIIEITNMSGGDVIMFSAEPILMSGEKLMAAHSTWFGMEDGLGE